MAEFGCMREEPHMNPGTQVSHLGFHWEVEVLQDE